MSEESKFNFSEDEQQINKDKAVEDKKQAVRQDAKGLFESIRTFLSELLDFRDDTDRDATITAIKGDISFKGATAWILICSIFVASVGLNANSTAVVIGAMLISPLMGPILGVGMSIAINDIDTLRKSLINLATMIVLSLLTAFLFFRFFPLGSQETSELLGRVQPDIRDVLIAFFGGLALIIARTKKGTIASVIFGVAIATALMPPLCTAGYGLANGNWPYFLGAMNLFTINTIFIALATFIVLKLLRFPMLKYANSAKRKRIARIASLVAFVVMIYPVITFVKVYKESRLNNDYNLFIQNDVESNDGLFLQRHRLDNENNTVRLYFINEIVEATKSDLENELKKYEYLKEYELFINFDNTRSSERLSQSLDRAFKDLDEKETIIIGLRQQIERLKIATNTQDDVSFDDVFKDAKIQFRDLEYFGYSKMLVSKDFIRIDTVNVASTLWNASLNDSVVKIKDAQFQKWLKGQLKIDSLVIKKPN